MNSNVMPSRVQLDAALLQQLVAEVKETVATEVTMQKQQRPASFKAIDLWNIRRNRKFMHSGTSRKKNTFVSVTHVSF